MFFKKSFVAVLIFASLSTYGKAEWWNRSSFLRGCLVLIGWNLVPTDPSRLKWQDSDLALDLLNLHPELAEKITGDISRWIPSAL